MKKYYCLIFLTILLNTLVYSQTDRFEAAVKKALNSDLFFTDDEFFGISTKDSLTIDEQFQFSEVARRMHAISIAEAGYLRVIRMDTSNKKIDYPTAVYQVGAMKKLQGDYEGALRYFEQYISSPPPIDNQFLALARKDIDDCTFAIPRTKKLDNLYNINHLGEEINTPYNDFAPLLVADKLYYTSLKYQKEEKLSPPRLYAKMLNSDLKTTGFPIDGFNQPEKSVAHLAFTKDETRAYYTICDYVGKSRKIQCKLYYQDKTSSGTWSKAKALPNYINRKGFTATHPTVLYDENNQEILLFSSNCPGGAGQLDVWYTEVGPKGDFSKAVNFSQINTPGNEVTPFFHQPTNTLYFSSTGREGLGGYDIYKYVDGVVMHAGYPLNSSFNDTHFSLDPSGDKGHFSSSRQGCLRLSAYDMGCQDIFAAAFINIDLEALTFEDFSKKDLEGVTLQLFKIPEGSQTESGTPVEVALIEGRTNTLDNQFQFDGLLRDARYRLVASKEGYINDTLNFNTRGIAESITLKKALFLAPDIFEMDLTALTFDAEYQRPLTNCIVQLIDKKSGERFITDNIADNDFYFDIYSQRDYVLIASLIGYNSDTLEFDTRSYTKAEGITSITKRLYLRPGGIVALEDLLPLTLYFDNDAPDPGSREVVTAKNYEELFAAYYRKKREFIANYSDNTPSPVLDDKTQTILDFFENDLKGNYDTLGVFSETLIKYLQRGNTAVISIRGFASPLAATDYNVNLGKRRVNCLMNHFSVYRDGMLNRYMEDGSLVLKEVSYGEEQANKSISENPKDRRNSVYSPEASKERKVQIVKIIIGEKSEGK
ncbi:MAG: hypothetical protein AB8G86_03370 [Saprospiraceae bacterium]